MTKQLSTASAEYIQESLDNNMGNSKQFWENITKGIPDKISNSKVSFHLFVTEKDVLVPTEHTADFISKLFTNISPK